MIGSTVETVVTGLLAWYQRADLKLSLAGDTVDGRAEPRKIEIHLCGFDRSLCSLNLGLGRRHGSFRCQIVLNGVVKVLLAGSLLFRQRRVSVHVELSSPLNRFGVSELRLGLGELSFGLIEHGLEGPRINFEEKSDQ